MAAPWVTQVTVCLDVWSLVLVILLGKEQRYIHPQKTSAPEQKVPSLSDCLLPHFILLSERQKEGCNKFLNVRLYDWSSEK